MAFPSSPTDGQTTTLNNVTYVYNATLGVWNTQGSVADASPVASVAGRTGAVTLTAADIAAGTFPGAIIGASTFTSTGVLSATSGTASSSTSTGALQVQGGAGISGAAYIGGVLNVAGAASLASLSVSGSTTFSGGLSTPTLTLSNATGPQISVTGATSNWINFGSTGVAPPAFTTRSAGSKLVLYENIGAASAGYAIGIDGSTMWFSTDTTTASYKWYGGTTNHTTLTGGGSLTLTGTCQTTSLGVGTAPSGTTGEGRFTNAITAYYSDERLKTKINTIENALDKIDQLTGFIYKENDLARSFGFNNPNTQVALSAQAVQIVQPEAVKPAPFDIAQRDDGTEYSKSGENYLTVDYERLIPLLVEGIKELRKEINQLKGK
jgi:hypothetical protein